MENLKALSASTATVLSILCGQRASNYNCFGYVEHHTRRKLYCQQKRRCHKNHKHHTGEVKFPHYL